MALLRSFGTPRIPRLTPPRSGLGTGLGLEEEVLLGPPCDGGLGACAVAAGRGRGLPVELVDVLPRCLRRPREGAAMGPREQLPVGCSWATLYFLELVMWFCAKRERAWVGAEAGLK